MVAITMGARCWDGERRTELVSERVIKEVRAEVEKIVADVQKKDFYKKLGRVSKIGAGYIVPIALLASGLPPLGLGRALAASFPVGGKVFWGDPNAPAPIVTKGLPEGTVIIPPQGQSLGVTPNGSMAITPTPVAPATTPPIEAGSVVPPDAIVIPAFGEGIKNTIIHAFDPLIELIQTLAIPIAGIMIFSGCLYMMFDKSKGIDMMRNAAIGYILVQLAPLLLKLLIGIGNAV